MALSKISLSGNAVENTLPIANGGTAATTLAGAGLASTPSFSAYIASDQTLSDNTDTKGNYDTESYDTDSAYDTTNKRFTAPE